MPDFSAPGSEGTLPAGHDEFQHGLIYTVHPRVLAPLRLGEEYRVTVCTRRKISGGPESFAPLYRRARTLASARGDELVCEQTDVRPRTWIASHAWFRMEMSRTTMVGAVVTLGVSCGAEGELTSGEPEPTADDLTRPSVAALTPTNADYRSRRWDELYNEFDIRDEQSTTGSIVTFSYGEYVSGCAGIEFADYVDRAERRARRCYKPLTGDSSPMLPIVRRDWTCIATDKASKVCLVHVNVYLQT
jgi:hypothetical protein